MVYTADLKSLPTGRQALPARVCRFECYHPNALLHTRRDLQMKDAGVGYGVIVYVLRSHRDGGLYIGLTTNIRRRLEEHNRGYQRSTKSRRPFDVMLTEEFASLQEAREREKQHKTGAGREALRRLLRAREEPSADSPA